MVRAEGIWSRDLYEVADSHHVQLRKLNYRRYSLEDIFLKAMETTNGRI